LFFPKFNIFRDLNLFIFFLNRLYFIKKNPLFLQNNAAAARYRRRQRQVESGLQEEFAELERRNWELKAEMAKIRAEIDKANCQLRAARGEKP
jgi:cell division protein FtsB